MSIATRNNTPSPTHHGGNALDAGEEAFDLPFHINCSKCHHMHKHVPLRVHKDPQRFTKFHCENCQHQIAGIGRNETQSSFGSTETQPVEAGYSRPLRPSNLQCCTNADLPNRRLSDVDEARPTLSSPSQSMRPGPSLLPHQDSHNDDQGLRSQVSVRNEASGPTTESLPKNSWRLIHKLKQGKKHLLKRSMNMRFFRSSFWKWEGPWTPGDAKTTVDPVIPSKFNSITRDFEHRPREGDKSVQLQGDGHPPTPLPESERRPSSVEEHLQAIAQKNERLRQRRRHATLKWNFLSRPVCHCEANCACMGGGSVSTDEWIGSPSTSRRSTRANPQQAADDTTNALPPNIFNFTGGPPHLSYPGGPLDNTILDAPAETVTMPNARLSQATTIGDAGEA